jgi:hypothetical protein
LSTEPRRARGRVARKDSVLYDQVGASIRVETSSRRADKAIDRQRDIGRREFEMRQRRNASAVKESESRSNALQRADLERLEAADRADIAARAEARKVAIERDFSEQLQVREQARSAFYQGSDSNQANFQSLVTNAQQQRDQQFNANVSTRATAVKERQRDVFDLQLQYAEQRRFVEANPLEAVGDETTKNLALSRTGEEKFKSFKASKGIVLDRIAEQRSSKVSAQQSTIKELQTESIDQTKERSQNVRRRLASTYRAQAGGANQSRGSL